MANDYQKINTLFLRDENSIIIPDKFTCAEFEYLKDNKWECTEKIDGTNIHIDILFERFKGEDGSTPREELTITYNGRTSKAQIPAHLHSKLCEIFGEVDFGTIFHDSFQSTRDNDEDSLLISIYGEGYGAKIQRGGNYIKDDCGFILFDVRVGKWWLNRHACEVIAELMNVPIVPIIGYMTIPEAIEFVKQGFKSTIAQNPDYDAEGLVLKTPCALNFRNGQRIITKIKTCDFRKYQAKYGDGPVNQTPNSHYNQ